MDWNYEFFENDYGEISVKSWEDGCYEDAECISIPYELVPAFSARLEMMRLKKISNIENGRNETARVMFTAKEQGRSAASNEG